MSYDSARKRKIEDVLRLRIDLLVESYQENRPIIVLLPGGTGSQLDRSERSYDSGSDSVAAKFSTVWIDEGVLFGDLLTLGIDAHGHDMSDHVVVATGPIEVILDVYTSAEGHFRRRYGNYVVFPYDWRRQVEESARFLIEFLRQLRAAISAAHPRVAAPGRDIVLVAHSMGGLVAVLSGLQLDASGENLDEWFRLLITVGTPFYGTGNQLPCMYVGQEPFNIIYKRTALAQTIATMPGPYTLLQLDRATYLRDGPRIGLERYPIRDAVDDSDLDPAEPALFLRYPPWVDRDALRLASQVRRTIVGPLPAALRDRIFHLRAGSNEKTDVALRWRRTGADFNPETDVAFDAIKGRGDGTVPEWSARLAEVPDERVLDLKQANNHPMLLRHAETLNAISEIVEQGRVAAPVETIPDAPSHAPNMAHSVETLRGIREQRILRGDLRLRDPRLWETLIR